MDLLFGSQEPFHSRAVWSPSQTDVGFEPRGSFEIAGFATASRFDRISISDPPAEHRASPMEAPQWCSEGSGESGSRSCGLTRAGWMDVRIRFVLIEQRRLDQ